MNYQERFLQWARFAQGELDNLLFVVRDKGVRSLARSIAIVVAALFFVYRAVAAPAAARLGNIKSRLAAVDVTSQYLERYKMLDYQLQSYRARLPDSKDRGAWLIDMVRKSMKEEGISLASFSSVEEVEADGVVLTSMNVNCRAGYKQIASWLARMEASRYFLRVTALNIRKMDAEVGSNDVAVTVVTAASKQGAPL